MFRYLSSSFSSQQESPSNFGSYEIKKDERPELCRDESELSYSEEKFFSGRLPLFSFLTKPLDRYVQTTQTSEFKGEIFPVLIRFGWTGIFLLAALGCVISFCFYLTCKSACGCCKPENMPIGPKRPGQVITAAQE